MNGSENNEEKVHELKREVNEADTQAARLEKKADALEREALEIDDKMQDPEQHGEHHHQKMVTIIVNGTPHEWPKGEITYAQVVTLDVPDYSQHPEITYSVKYKNGHGNKPEGTLPPGASVKAKEGMVFSVSPTGQS